MKVTKTLLCLTLALSLMTGLLIPTMAASITLDQAQSVVVNDETPAILQFIPTKSGYYSFYSYNSQGYDPCGYIMDASLEVLVQGDDTEDTMDFSISCYMTAGNTYFLAATCYSGSAQYTVQIKELLLPTSISFDKDVYVGSICGYLYPTIEFYPLDSAQENVTLSSSNEKVVRIGEFGDFYLGIPGTATVTATSDSGLTATCTVTVEPPAALTLDTPWTLDADLGDQYLSFTAPSEGWYGISSQGDEVDPWVEVLDESLEGIIQDDETLPEDNFFAPVYLKAGQLCYFGFHVNNNRGTAQVTLERLSAADSVSLPNDRITGYADTVCWLVPMYVPQISIPEELTWKSSNEDVVCVDELGYVSFLEPGSAVITVTSETGKTDSVAVTVLPAPADTGLTAWGICGPNLQWQLSSNGTLTVTGSGDMYALYNNDNHWDDYSDRITRVVFPDGITSIGYGAFLSCTKLTELEIPNSVRSIGSSAFSNCYALTRVTLPDTLDSVGQDLFGYCSSLEQVNLPQNLKRLPLGTFEGCTSLSEITLPQSLVSIGERAFSGCPLEAIELPDGLKTIGYAAFAGADLIQITLPEGLTELGDLALVNCSLEELTIPSTVTALGDGFVSGNHVHTLRFLGDAPAFHDYALDFVAATAYYPAGNRTWTEEVRQNYGGTITWIPEGNPGVTLSGTMKEGATLTLSLWAEVLETVCAETGSYSFDQLLPGSYTLTATATNHATRTYTLTVADQPLTQDVTIHLLGDIDGNGKVNIGDVAKLTAHIKGTALLTDDYILDCANVNGGKLNMGDTASLYAHIRGTKKLY